MAITLPHNFHDNVSETASGVQVMDNLNTLKAAGEELQAGILPGSLGLLYAFGGHALQFKGSGEQSLFVGASTPLFGTGNVLEWPTLCVATWVGQSVSYASDNATPLYVAFNIRSVITNGASGSKSSNAAACQFQSTAGNFYIRTTVYGLGY